MAMSLDGLRAWIGLVERKLTMRTRVFLVLVALAVGGAGAAIVLAIDAQDNAVTKDDLQAVRDELAGTAAPVESTGANELEAEIETLRSEVAAMREANVENGPEAQKPSDGTARGATAPQNRQQLKAAGEEAIEEAEGKDGK
jgi:cell division protein FtsB